ncbi:unnamed protein product [Mortierella alpina]
MGRACLEGVVEIGAHTHIGNLSVMMHTQGDRLWLPVPSTQTPGSTPQAQDGRPKATVGDQWAPSWDGSSLFLKVLSQVPARVCAARKISFVRSNAFAMQVSPYARPAQAGQSAECSSAS